MTSSSSSWKKSTLTVLFVFILSACVTSIGNPTETTPPINLTTASPLSPELSIITIESTQLLPVEPTLTPTAHPIPEFTNATPFSPIIKLEEMPVPVCNGMGQVVQVSQSDEIPGAIFYQKGDYGWNGVFMLRGLDLQTEMLSDGAEQRVEFHGVSPDGNWVAFSPAIYSEDIVAFASPTMVLLSSQGEHKEIPIDVSPFAGEEGTQGYFIGFGTGYWINNDWLYLELISAPFPGEGTMWSYIPALFNPFTEVWNTEWLKALPDRYINRAARVKVGEIGLSPDLSTALYPTEGSGIALYDRLNNNVIWKNLLYFNYHGVSIRWSPDSAYVAVGNNYVTTFSVRSLLILSRNGDFILEIVDGKHPSNLYQLHDMVWSPDGRYLAFVFDSDFTEGSHHEIFLFDRTTNQYTYRCPLNDFSSVVGLIWSPDSKWVGVKDSGSPMRVLEIETGKVIELLDRGSIVGWSDWYK
jgi:hypothetical protein